MATLDSTVPLVDSPILLVGATRSGTTLLSIMLDHHPEIAFVGEYAWVWDFMPAVAPPPMEDYYRWLRVHRHFIALKLEIDRSLQFKEQLNRFLADMRAQKEPACGTPNIGCQIHRHYARALDQWPEARFIHIVRDGRDVAASWIKLGWLGNGYAAARRWQDALSEWESVSPRIDRARRIDVRFEDLIAHPVAQLGRLMEFIGTDYDDAMLRYHEDTTYGPVDASQGGKWRKSLTARELARFETFAGDALVAQGYELSGAPVYSRRPWSERLLALDDKVRHNQARIRTYGAGLWLAEHVVRRLGLPALHDRIRLRFNAIDNANVQ